MNKYVGCTVHEPTYFAVLFISFDENLSELEGHLRASRTRG